MSQSRIKAPKIVQPGSGVSPWWLLLVPVIMAAGMWAAYEYGRTEAAFDAAASDKQIRSLQTQVRELEEERVGLYQQAAALERSSQIDKEAARTVRDEIKVIQDERLEMEEELTFLRGIVSNHTAGKGALRVQDFKLATTEEPGEVQYEFTVSHTLEGLKKAKGKILINVDGVLDQKAQSLPLEQLNESKANSLRMGFKHFQKVSGRLRLPEGFIASSVTIDVKPEGKKLSPASQTFKWSLGG